ncbi:MAG: UvrD-helicase domain-containing protein [Defluviitaleaceae bacterium]|nr:UvrD-helicase domain-containing protein [Defluviitaleaceae bacterium]
MNSELNSEQLRAVQKIDGPLLILAGAGSGKTRVITHRIVNIINSGVQDYNILALTFTNKAAKEMRERVDKLLDSDNRVWISTFHSLCVRILRLHIDVIGYNKNFTIYDSSDSKSLIKESMKILNISEKDYRASSVASKISNFKNELYTPLDALKEAESLRDENIAKIYKMYQHVLKQNNALDFDDIILKTLEIFKVDSSVLKKYRNRFKYIMVDEYQDTNMAQYNLINLLSKEHKNLCVVGDDDQSIYGWRGADINNILDFEKDFEDTTVIRLEQNYRSKKNILESANCVIQNNITRKHKILWTKNKSEDKVYSFSATDDREEAIFLCEKIKNSKEDYKDIGILYRKNNLSRVIEEKLVQYNIPYKIFGGIRFYDRKEIKDIMAYLLCIYNSNDSVSLKRIINVPKRGIGLSTVDKISEFSVLNEVSFYSVLNNRRRYNIKSTKIDDFVDLINDLKKFEGSVSQLINYILEKTKYIEKLDGDDIENQTRHDNIKELINKAIIFEQVSEVKTLGAFLEEVALVSDIDNLEDDRGYVSLMTIHSAKGLEFKTVFIVGFEYGIFPSYRSLENITEYEEERRLCYVAITRAKENLYISHAKSRLENGKLIRNDKSVFLSEIPKELLENVTRYEKSDIFINKKSEINKANNSIDSKNLENTEKIIVKNKPKISAPKNIVLDFGIGDTVMQTKYGKGTVTNIAPAGADYEITIDFDGKSRKIMASFFNIKKV